MGLLGAVLLLLWLDLYSQVCNIMGIITKMLKMDGVYWAPATIPRDDYGKPTYIAPVEIKVRWEQVAEEFIGPQGERLVSKVKVYVDRDVVIGGVLLLGELDSSVDESNPKQNEGAGEIRGFSKIPNLRATEYVRVAYL